MIKTYCKGIFKLHALLKTYNQSILYFYKIFNLKLLKNNKILSCTNTKIYFMLMTSFAVYNYF